MNNLPIWGELKHRVNNPLQIVVAAVDLVLEETADPRLQTALTAAFRAAAAVDEIATLLEDGANEGGSI